MKNSCIVLIAATCCVASGFGQDPAAKRNAPLTTEAIIELTQAGLPDDIIIQKIRTAAQAIDVSTDDLIALKKAGVPNSVIRALLVGPAPKPEAPSPGFSFSANTDPNDPLSPHDPGIYMMVPARDGERSRLVLIERAGRGREKNANIFVSAMTYGIVRSKTVAEIAGPRAPLRTSEPRPEFYLYFPPVGNLGAANSITSPSQFTLLRLEEKKDHREMTVLKFGITGMSSGNDARMTIQFDAGKIRPYAYRVTPDVNLAPGEYAFVAGSGEDGAESFSLVVFDFGVEK